MSLRNIFFLFLLMFLGKGYAQTSDSLIVKELRSEGVSFSRNNTSFMIKRHVVRAILRDIFRIMSHGIYFSSHAILKTSDGILFPTDKIGDNSEKIKKKSENVEKS